MRLSIENRWLPWLDRWEWDRGMTVDIGTTAAPTARGCALLIVDAGEDFVEVEERQA